MAKELSDGVNNSNPNIAKTLKEIVTQRKLCYDNACKSVTVTLLPNQNSVFIFFVYIFMRKSYPHNWNFLANMSPFGLPIFVTHDSSIHLKKIQKYK